VINFLLALSASDINLDRGGKGKKKDKNFSTLSRPLFVSFRVIFYIDPKKKKKKSARNRQIENPFVEQVPLTYKKRAGDQFGGII